VSDFINDIENSFPAFTKSWKDGLTSCTTVLDGQAPKFMESYRRLVTLNAWRETVVEQEMAEEAFLFFVEAQNDALVSHVFARMGAWRSALKSLRSCIENVMYGLYYRDHSIELRRWQSGDHRLPFKDLFEYFESHPDLEGASTCSGLAQIRQEYRTLSRAVHASARSFRMTKKGMPAFWQPDAGSLGAWSVREREVLIGLNLLLLAFFRRRLQGSALSGLRQAIALLLPEDLCANVKAVLGVNLKKPK